MEADIEKGSYVVLYLSSKMTICDSINDRDST